MVRKHQIVDGRWEMGDRRWGIGVISRCSNLRTPICYLYLLICYLLSPICLYGYTQLGFYTFGDVVSGFSARSVGMGSTGITTINDASALAVNPATLIDITANKMILSVNPSYILFEEKENLFDITNKNVYFQLTGLGIAVPVVRNILVLGVSNSPLLDYSYKYHYTSVSAETMTKNYDRSIVASGGLRSTDIGIGLKIIDPLRIGFSYSLLGNGNKGEYEYTDYDNGTIDWIYKSESSEYKGGYFKCGLIFNQANYTYGGFYQPSTVVEREMTVTDKYLDTGVLTSTKTVYEYEFKYPEKFGLGFSYRFKDKFRTLFAADWERQNWNVLTYVKKTIDGVATNNKRYHPAGYEKTDELKLGLEMWLTDSLPVRCGFRYQEFYATWGNKVYNWYHRAYITKKIVPTFYCFSFGTGYVMAQFDIDIGYEFGRRSYETGVFERYDEDLQRLVLTTRFRW